MCLAIPGRVESISTEGDVCIGRVNFGGIVKRVCLDYVPDIQVGDYTVVHVGFAISRIDEESAEKTLAVFRQMGMLDEELAGEEEAFSRAAQMIPSPCPDGSCAIEPAAPEEASHSHSERPD
jgi:hydrogenase expression/formation protein HypC